MNSNVSIISPLPAALGGRTVLIFGGTSGIGLSAAVQAKAAGAEVIVVGSDAERTKQAANDNELHGWRAADVTNSDAIKQAVADIPHVDHLVMLAGTLSQARCSKRTLTISSAHSTSASGQQSMCFGLSAIGLPRTGRSPSSQVPLRTCRKPMERPSMQPHRPQWKL
jgi:D-arabinose 1-dehydrogenase-like Zn-dependent alcohol dehydrogenase